MKRALVVGLGSIGKRHLANLRALRPNAEIAVLRHADTGAGIPPGADAVVYTIDEAIVRKPELVFVCGPTNTHVDIGIAFASAGADLFIEKPIAETPVGAGDLLDAVERHNRIVSIGYNLRFLPSLQTFRDVVLGGSVGRPLTIRAEVGQYLPDWRPATDYRKVASARREFGGGALLELSHEIDYVRWIMGEIAEVSALTAHLSDLDIDVEDTAEILLRFESGALGSIHLDMTDRVPRRCCRVVGTEGTATWDGISGEVAIHRPIVGSDVLVRADADRNRMYVEELEDMLAAIENRTVPQVSGLDGLRAVEVVAAARKSAADRCSVNLMTARS